MEFPRRPLRGCVSESSSPDGQRGSPPNAFQTPSGTSCGFSGLRSMERRGSLSHERWVCPNDRQLALRAKLQMGWSTAQAIASPQEGLSEAETEAIMDVVRKADELEIGEQKRIGRLVERVDRIRHTCLGNGSTTCILCGERISILRITSLTCADCSKAVCPKCGVEEKGIWLCKICSETREMWKRSGAWFFRGIPKHINEAELRMKETAARRANINKARWSESKFKTESIAASRSSAESEVIMKEEGENKTSDDDVHLRSTRRVASTETEIPKKSSCEKSTSAEKSFKLKKSRAFKKLQFVLSLNPSKPTGIPPVTPDPIVNSPSSREGHSRSRSLSPSPLRIDIPFMKSSLEKVFDRSPISPAYFGPNVRSKSLCN